MENLDLLLERPVIRGGERGLAASMVAGAVSGSAGSRVAQALGRRFGWEPSEGDLVPVFGALFEGATSAVVLNWLIYSIFGLK